MTPLRRLLSLLLIESPVDYRRRLTRLRRRVGIITRCSAQSHQARVVQLIVQPFLRIDIARCPLRVVRCLGGERLQRSRLLNPAPCQIADIRELVAEDMLIPVRFVDISQNQIDAEIGITILDSGRGNNFMIEARDITAHNRAVTALRQSIENLEHRVVVRTRALQDEVSERRRAEEMLRHVATHDGLTDLPNRSLMMDRLDNAIARAKRNKSKCAVMFLDLDGFKPINDTLGHDKGDLVLREAATRLSECIRDSDTAARFGGDEFVLVLSDLNTAEDSVMVAKKVLRVLSEPIELSGHTAQVGASIGIALYPDHGHNAETVLKHADIAMYDVKGSGKNNYAFAPTSKATP